MYNVSSSSRTDACCDRQRHTQTGYLALGLALTLLPALAKPDWGASCLDCHSARTGRMQLAGETSIADLGAGSRKVYRVAPGQTAAIAIEVLNGGGAYGLSVAGKSATGLQNSGNILNVPAPGTPWTSGSGYYYKSKTSADQTWTFNLQVDASTPADAYPFEVQIGIKSGGTLAQAEAFYVQVVDETPVNTVPVLAAIPDQTFAEMVGWSTLATATDTDAPAQTLTFSLGGEVPEGLAIDPATGGLTWVPTEAQGPGTYPVNVTVTDDGSPPLSATQTFSITVEEVNLEPVLNGIADQSAHPGATVSFTASASDPDLPAQSLTFSLSPGAPVGANIHPDTGAFSWTIPGDAPAGVQSAEVVVTDNGAPSRSASQVVNFVIEAVVVIDPPHLGSPQRNGDLLGFSVSTLAGHLYILEYKTSLSETTWITLSPVTGDGTEMTLTDPAPTGSARFYRVRVE